MAISKVEIEEITNHYYDDIYKFCATKCGNTDDASDITHEVFLAFVKKAPTLENSSIHSWLFKAADIEAKKYFRLKGKTELVPLKEDLFTCDDVFDSEPLSEEKFESLLTKTQKKILSILTDDEKRLFIKLYIEKKSVSVVSDELGITPNNTYVKSHRVKKKAKKVISTVDLMISVIIFKYF